MSSFEKRFYIENPTLWQALRRNARLLGMLLVGGLLWMTKGAMLRRAVRRAQRNGEAIILEDISG